MVVIGRLAHGKLRARPDDEHRLITASDVRAWLNPVEEGEGPPEKQNVYIALVYTVYGHMVQIRAGRFV